MNFQVSPSLYFFRNLLVNEEMTFGTEELTSFCKKIGYYSFANKWLVTWLGSWVDGSKRPNLSLQLPKG